MSLTLTRRHNVDRFGYLIPTRYGNVPMVGAVATYRPGEGRFGGAVAVEEGTTNLVTNGNMANGTTGWNPNQNVTLSVVEEVTPFGTLNFLKVVSNQSTSTPGVLSGEITVSSSTTYTYSLLGRRQAGSNAYLCVTAWDGSSWYGLVWTGPILPTEFDRVSITFTTGSSDTKVKVGVLWSGVSVGAWFEITQVQLEQKPYATSFVDGTRAGGRLEYPQSIWNHATGTFAAWVRTPIDVTTDRVLTLQWASDEAGTGTRFGIRMNTSGRFVVSYGSADTLTTADSYNDGEWYHVVLTWVDGTADIHLYVDGERVASASEPISVRNPGGRYRGVIPIGHRGYTYNDQWWNGLIDELLILPYAASEEEVVSWYEAQGLLPPHPQASLQWDRQTVRPAQMVKL